MFSIIPGLDEDNDIDAEEENDDISSNNSECRSFEPDDSVPGPSISSPGEMDGAQPPKGISCVMWEKFKNLQQRREEASKEKIPSYKRQRRKRGRKKAKSDDTDTERPKKKTYSVGDDSNDAGDDDEDMKKEHWQNLKQYVGVFDRFKGTDQGRLAPMSGLEKEIDKAIADGDIDTAEKLNERLVQRDLGEKIAEAADARDFAIKRKEEEEEKKSKKRTKPVWTFESKQRWEMKAAM